MHLRNATCWYRIGVLGGVGLKKNIINENDVKNAPDEKSRSNACGNVRTYTLYNARVDVRGKLSGPLKSEDLDRCTITLIEWKSRIPRHV